MRDRLELEKATAQSTTRSLLNAVPFLGTALTELMFDMRGRIKQDRINKFVSEFHAYLDGVVEADLHIDQIEKEDFGDFFEALLLRVAFNHSEAKRNAFQRLLGNQLQHPADLDYALLFVDIISNLHEKQIPILERFFRSQLECGMHTRIQAKLTNLRRDYFDMTTFKDRMDNDVYAEGMLDTGTGTGKLEQKIRETKEAIEIAEKDLRQYDAAHRPVIYKLKETEFFTLANDLCSKGLLTDFSSKYAYNPLSVVEISDLGKRLMEALIPSEKSVEKTKPNY